MEKNKPSYAVGGNLIVAATMENSMEVPLQTQIRVTI